MRIVVSLHLAKTGGTSIGGYLVDHVSPSVPVLRLLNQKHPKRGLHYRGAFEPVTAVPDDDDFGDVIEHVATYADTLVIHGHASVRQWLALPYDVEFITWLREPLARIESHFDFWRLHAPPLTNAGAARRLRDRVAAGECSLEEFGCHENVANYYSNVLRPYTLDDLATFGLLEYPELSLARLHEHLGLTAVGQLKRLRVTESALERRSDRLTVEQRQNVARANALDVRLYEDARAEFETQNAVAP